MFEYRSGPLGTRPDAGVPAAFAHGAHVDYVWSYIRSTLISLLRQGWNPSHHWDSEDQKRIHLAAHDAEHNSKQLSFDEEFLPVSQSSTVTHRDVPIHNLLPPEILGEIFIWCIPSDASMNSNSSAPEAAPLLLLRVCRLWKYVALGTPQLWTKLGLCGLQGVNPLALVSAWLRRSGTLPIDVYINPLTWHYPINLHFFKTCVIPDIVKLLRTDLHRVRTFHTTNFPAILDGLISRDVPVDMPLLRDFRITSSPKSSGLFLTGHITAPNLVSLEICDPHITLESITPNYYNLLSLCWNGSNASDSWNASLDHLVPLLQSCPNLEELDIIRPKPSQDFLVHRTTIALPCLRHLSILWKETVDIMGFLHHLDLPALESLRMEMERTTSTRANLQLILGALFPPDSPPPPLRFLYAVHLDTMVADADPPPHAFSPSLQFPTLERLCLEDCGVHSAFLAALTPEPEAPLASWSLPRLAALHVSRAGLDGVPLVRMVAARSRSLSAFRELSLSDCGGISSLDIAVLRGLADRGVLVVRLEGMGSED